MEFTVFVLYKGKKIAVQVKRTFDGEAFERFTVFAGKTTVELRTNFNKRKGKEKIEWKIEEGEEGIADVKTFVTVIAAMENHFEQTKK